MSEPDVQRDPDAFTDYRFEHRPTWDASCRVYATRSVHPSVHIGARTVVWWYAVILEGTVIGADCLIADCVSIGRRVQIGDGSRIQHGTALPDDMRIGQRVFIGSNVSCADVAYPLLAQRTAEVHRPPVIEDEVSIGCNAVLCPGVVIGQGAVVGAGSVVTRDIKAGAIYVGNPAKPLLTPRRVSMAVNEAGQLLGGNDG